MPALPMLNPPRSLVPLMGEALSRTVQASRQPVDPASPFPLRLWYTESWQARALAPLSWLFGLIAKRRRTAVLSGRRVPWRAPVPVLVVGNLTVGGTGKTPFTIWLVRQLLQRGLRPGVVSRGYTGRGAWRPLAVSADSDPETVGDEPPIIARQTGVPVVVCRGRVQAVRHLTDEYDVNVVVSDDGLQHYALARDIEIAVIDGSRGFGNGRLLPAGPMREPPHRLAEVDWVISSRQPSGLAGSETVMRLQPTSFVNLHTGASMGPDRFRRRNPNVHALAGIGNPDAFARSLRELGLRALLHPLKDHHRFSGEEVRFDDGWPVVCTEKDAVKLKRLDTELGHCWCLQVTPEVGEAGRQRLDDLLRRHSILA